MDSDMQQAPLEAEDFYGAHWLIDHEGVCLAACQVRWGYSIDPVQAVRGWGVRDTLAFLRAPNACRACFGICAETVLLRAMIQGAL